MTLEFDRPIGAKADVSEILYVSTLHQTSEILREDGSINADDISLFLVSRYGLSITPEAVKDTILKAYGGEKIDLVELVSILFIPQFCKFASPPELTEDLENLCPHVIKGVLKMVLHDVTGDDEPKELTVELIREIFLRYGETEVAENESLLNDMLLAATGGDQGVMLN